MECQEKAGARSQQQTAGAAPRRGIAALQKMANVCSEPHLQGQVPYAQATPEGLPEDGVGLRAGSKTQNMHGTLSSPD